MHKITKIILLLHTFLIPIIAEPKAYCQFKEPIQTYVTVVKTREVYKEATGLWKAFRKGKFVTENYEDKEIKIEYKTVTKCCEGYEMSKHNICTAICKQSCQENAQCVEPDICKCRHGYRLVPAATDDKDYCAPVCTNGCSENERCAAPNTCVCELGFYAIDNECRAQTPIPPSTIEAITESTKFVPASTTTSTKFVPEITTTSTHLKIEPTTMQSELSSETGFAVLSSSVIPSDDSIIEAPSSTSIPSIQCPEGFEANNDDCRPISLPNNEQDCRTTPCFEHAQCVNGTCVCEEGFSYDAVQKACIEDPMKANFPLWLGLPVGVLCIVGVGIIVLHLFLRKRFRGTFYVENSKYNHDLHCQYENRSFCGSQNSI